MDLFELLNAEWKRHHEQMIRIRDEQDSCSSNRQRQIEASELYIQKITEVLNGYKKQRMF